MDKCYLEDPVMYDTSAWCYDHIISVDGSKDMFKSILPANLSAIPNCGDADNPTEWHWNPLRNGDVCNIRMKAPEISLAQLFEDCADDGVFSVPLSFEGTLKQTKECSINGTDGRPRCSQRQSMGEGSRLSAPCTPRLNEISRYFTKLKIWGKSPEQLSAMKAPMFDGETVGNVSINYPRYFELCGATTCTYTYTGPRSSTDILTAVLGQYGGLAAILTLVLGKVGRGQYIKLLRKKSPKSSHDDAEAVLPGAEMSSVNVSVEEGLEQRVLTQGKELETLRRELQEMRAEMQRTDAV